MRIESHKKEEFSILTSLLVRTWILHELNPNPMPPPDKEITYLFSLSNLKGLYKAKETIQIGNRQLPLYFILSYFFTSFSFLLIDLTIKMLIINTNFPFIKTKVLFLVFFFLIFFFSLEFYNYFISLLYIKDLRYGIT